MVYRLLSELIRLEVRLWGGLAGYQWGGLALIPLFVWLWQRDSLTAQGREPLMNANRQRTQTTCYIRVTSRHEAFDQN